LPKAETRPATTQDIYQAFPELPQAGLRTRIEYFREMGLTSDWPRTQELWFDAAKDSASCWGCLTNWGSVVCLIPSLAPEEQKHYLLLSRFLCAANASCFSDAGGEKFSAVADIAGLVANWPRKPVTNEDVKYDISPLYYRLLESSKDVAGLHGAITSVIANSPVNITLRWAVRNGITSASSESQSLPGFSAGSVAGTEMSANVDLSNYIRHKTSGTIAFPFSIPRGDYDPAPKARYPNYLFDQWVNCRNFSWAGQPNGAEMLRLWNEDLNGKLADIIQSHSNPLMWLKELGGALTGHNKAMVKKIQGELKKLVDDALKQLEGATKPSRVPLELEGIMAEPAVVPIGVNEFVVEIKKSQVTPLDWISAESVTDQDLIFLKGEAFRPLAITRIGDDTINIRVVRGNSV